jgi:hypothetical protein
MLRHSVLLHWVRCDDEYGRRMGPRLPHGTITLIISSPDDSVFVNERRPSPSATCVLSRNSKILGEERPVRQTILGIQFQYPRSPPRESTILSPRRRRTRGHAELA